MGCFDSVCSVSHIPVHTGDDTVILYVGAEPTSSYRPFLFEPIMFPMFGEYNDYGELENIDENSIGWREGQWMIEHEFKDVIKPTRRESDAWEAFKDNVHMSSGQCMPNHWNMGGPQCEWLLEEPPSYDPDRISYKQVRGNGTVVSKMFIHRKVYDYMVQSYMNVEFGWGEEAVLFGTYMEDISEYIEEIAKKEKLVAQWQLIDADDTTGQEEFFKVNNMTSVYDLMGLSNLMTLEPVDDKDYKFGNGNNRQHPLVYIMKGDRETRPMEISALRIYRKKLQALCRDDKLVEAEELLRTIIELYCFVGGLQIHNHEISPYNGFAFEQYQEPFGANNMVNLFNICQEIQNKKIVDYGEDYEE